MNHPSIAELPQFKAMQDLIDQKLTEPKYRKLSRQIKKVNQLNKDINDQNVILSNMLEEFGPNDQVYQLLTQLGQGIREYVEKEQEKVQK